MTDLLDPPADGRDDLLGQLLRFGQLLRLMGLQVSLRQMLDLVEATEHVPITDKYDFYCAARALLVVRREDLPVFDEAFALFWRSEEQPAGGREVNGPARRARLPREGAAGSEGNDDGERKEPAPAEGGTDEPAPGDGARLVNLSVRRARYSAREALRTKDFGEMSWEEVQAAKRAIAKLEWRLGRRLTRRYRRGRKGKLDLRRVVRENLANEGELISLPHRTRAQRLRPLVVLCDVSGSMERYSRMLLHFVHALTHGLDGVDVEAFVFSTRLTRITHHLRHRDIDECLDRVGKAVPDWSAGTRIGEAIRSFNYHWARRTLGRGAVVLVISDGWDRGDVDLLASEAARLQRSAYRLIWLNPLVGADGYEPSQRGMAAALGFVDDLLPGRNLAGLEQLAEILSGLHLERPTAQAAPAPAACRKPK